MLPGIRLIAAVVRENVPLVRCESRGVRLDVRSCVTREKCRKMNGTRRARGEIIVENPGMVYFGEWPSATFSIKCAAWNPMASSPRAGPDDAAKALVLPRSPA